VQAKIDQPTSDERIRRARSFELFLQALYRRAYIFTQIAEIEDLVKLADYYLALSCVSSFIERNLLLSPEAVRQIPECASRLLHTAAAILSRLLFNEAFIHTVGKWNTTNEDKKIECMESVGMQTANLILTYHAKIQEKVNKLFRFSLSGPKQHQYPSTEDELQS
jgi:hypothetical protein